MRGRTWLERNWDMTRFSSKNSEEYKIVEPGDIWGDSSDNSVCLVYLSLFTCAWFANLKREIILNLLRSKTRYSFSASLPKKSSMHAVEKMYFYLAGNIFETRVWFGSSALAVKRPRSSPCFAMYYIFCVSKVWIYKINFTMKIFFFQKSLRCSTDPDLIPDTDMSRPSLLA